MGSYIEEREKWVEEEIAARIEKHGGMSAYHQRILRSALKKEFEDVWSNRDYVYGQDEGMHRSDNK